MQIEGFLILASQDHTRKYYWQGGSFIGEQYLQVLMDHGDPVGAFHAFTAGTRGRILPPKEGANSANPPTAGNNAHPAPGNSTPPAPGNNVPPAPSNTGPLASGNATRSEATSVRNAPRKQRKPRHDPGAALYKDVCLGDAVKNRNHLTVVLGKMFFDANGGDSGHWPGKNTDARLAEYKLKLVIKPNKLNLDSLIRNKQIKTLKIDQSRKVLRGLKRRLIKLVPMVEGDDGKGGEGGGSKEKANAGKEGEAEENQGNNNDEGEDSAGGQDSDSDDGEEVEDSNEAFESD
ncbi:hypothetical protein PCANC_09186 [Puccinia coronata f. sp. avenae]|uniref:Uncharacterized protein n=1 Tax=Puccinia coronata f. sp. avenae TaxID=200324 RepID=A0A2N5VV49_9BASI|nr:hypothetical protein PCASD_15880 [Puccinia coronata f. sp. avenae]PLW53859.1 hypothetical protein PCANC_09186 [Puccinia coronata f. sp. avenae]